jgi:hypothetical protein
MMRLAGRAGLFACGDVLEGAIAVGMDIHWSLQGGELTTYTPIASVDYLDVDRKAGQAEVVLGIQFDEGAEELEPLFEELFEPGMIVDVDKVAGAS